MIIQAASLTPKFDIDEFVYEPVTIDVEAVVTTATTPEGDCTATTTAPCPTPSTPSQVWTPFGIAVIAGVGSGPVQGVNTYQDDKLKNAVGVEIIVVNHSTEMKVNQDFTIDTVTGILSRWQGDGVTPNDWFDGDVLVVPTFFKLV